MQFVAVVVVDAVELRQLDEGIRAGADFEHQAVLLGHVIPEKVPVREAIRATRKGIR